MNGLLAQQPSQPAQAPQMQAPQMQAPNTTEEQANTQAASLDIQVKKIVIAAQHVMYSEGLRDKFIADLSNKLKQTSPAEAAGTMAIDVILILIGQSNFKMNPKAVVPAGIMIAGNIMEFIEQATKTNLPDSEAHKAIDVFVNGIMSKIGGNRG